MGAILVADDDRTCRDSIQKVLEREGHCVRTADSVDCALDAMGRDHYDLVVCDYRMQGKTGIDLLVELKRRDVSVPVLMISAYADAPAEDADDGPTGDRDAFPPHAAARRPTTASTAVPVVERIRCIQFLQVGNRRPSGRQLTYPTRDRADPLT